MINLDLIINALNDGLICLIPTDTILGLSCHPFIKKAHARLCELKKRDKNKPFVYLIHSSNEFLRYFKDLHDSWKFLLLNDLPPNLTIVWEKIKNLELNSLALRAPRDVFLKKLILKFNKPLPSTSVNISCESPITSWEKAVDWAKKFKNIYIPDFDENFIKNISSNKKTSAIIKITGRCEFEIIRDGDVDFNYIKNYLINYDRNKF